MSLNGKADSSATDTEIENPNGFFPDISVRVFIETYRLPDEYDEAPMVFELNNAIRHVNEELLDFVLILQSVKDAESLAEVNAELVPAYKAAVMGWARSALIKYFETVGRKAAAEIQGERNEIIVTEWKGDAQRNIDWIAKRLLLIAEAHGAVPKRRKYADGFRASIL
ncbi:head completion/stabilization protein [Marinomonas aquiplantarum]|uniref:Head completion protein GPL n=1 Tax=Marinomonas aquiplantarum TaxID=491951 RepID=A0A366D1Q4_9GAMM|nr:head completion/stabilization protein [Marinomonas aquiplantarum]RBO83429.1 head completion protein GPL [Marinomonas aquiplantarum]